MYEDITSAASSTADGMDSLSWYSTCTVSLTLTFVVAIPFGAKILSAPLFENTLALSDILSIKNFLCFSFLL